MAQVSKDFEFDLSSEFIESEKSYKRIKKKGGPDSKDEKVKRQNEVYRLHCEYGYPARKIAEMMKINRNTVNSDINYWYNKISIAENVLDPETAIMVNIQRFNVQRSRLRENLDEAENFQQRHAIEKMIFNIDSKIIQIQMNLANSMSRIDKLRVGHLNGWLKENKKDIQYLTYSDTLLVSEKAKARISKIIEEDRKKIGI